MPVLSEGALSFEFCLFFTSGLADRSEESVRQLGQLMCLNGFCTDASQVGVERIVVTRPRPSIGMVSPCVVPAQEINADYEGGDMLDAHGLVYCKGWLRCVTATFLVLLAFDYPHFYQAAVSFAKRCMYASKSSNII